MEDRKAGDRVKDRTGCIGKARGKGLCQAIDEPRQERQQTTRLQDMKAGRTGTMARIFILMGNNRGALDQD